MELRKVASVLLCATVAWCTGCSKSVEGEGKKWDRNKEAALEMKVRYPAFATIVQTEVDSAADKMTSAQAESDDDAKIAKMDEANVALTKGVVGKLQRIDQKQKKIKKEIVTVTTKAKDEGDRLAAKTVASEATQALAAAKQKLDKGSEDASAAGMLLQIVDTDLTAVLKNIDRVGAKIRSNAAKTGKQTPPKATPGSKTGKTTPNAKTTPVTTATWKCQYCKNQNKASKVKCASCGAGKK